MKRQDILTIILRAVLYLALTFISIVMCFPLFWMLSTSLKTMDEILAPGIVWIPKAPSIAQYAQVLTTKDFLTAFFNSAFVAALSLAGTLISIAIVAYAFSRLEWPGKNLVFFLMLSTMMIPQQAIVLPQYVMMYWIHWIGTFNPIVIPGFFAGGASFIFLLRQAMAQIPKELDESAFMDGANHFQIWWNVIVPNTVTPLATIATLLFIGFWNSLLMPSLFLTSKSMYTLTLYMGTLINPNFLLQPWNTLMTSAILTTVPLIIVFFIMQKYIMQGIMTVGLK